MQCAKLMGSFAMGLGALRRNSGFSLISMMIATSIMGFSMSALVSLMVRQEKGGVDLGHRFDNARLQQSLLSAMMNSEICTCHFVVDSGSTVTLDTQGLGDIPMGFVRSSCDFSSQDNILVEAGVHVPGSSALMVENIKVTDIKFTGTADRYSGNLSVEYNQESLPYPMGTFFIPLVLIVDSELGTGVAHPIESCWNSESQGEESPWSEVNNGNGGGGGGSTNDGSEAESASGFYNACMLMDFSSDEDRDGRTLVGCGGTANIFRPPHSTAFGFGAGLLSGSGDNTYLGYSAGGEHIGNQSTFVGYRAGQRAGNASANTAIGYDAGRYAQGGRQVFVGAWAGESEEGAIGEENVFVGMEAGQRNRNGSRNVAFGLKAGANNNDANDNVILGHYALQTTNEGFNVVVGYEAGSNFTKNNQVFLGYQAGKYISTGDRNIFVGAFSGGDSSVTGEDNVFMGYKTGHYNRGSRNVFLGESTGHGKSGFEAQENTFAGYGTGFLGENLNTNTVVGEEAGQYLINADSNVLVGRRAAYKASVGHRNVVLGERALEYSASLKDDSIYIGRKLGGGSSSASLQSSELILGVEAEEWRWLTGDISSTGNLYLNGQQVALTSSRELKKNIHPIKNIRKYVNSLIQTPLFIYQYKDKNLQPQKIRMGFISEELPEHLQIKKKGQLSHPDWPSIYGSFWASIQYIYGVLQRFEKTFPLRVKKVIDATRYFHGQQNGLIEDTMDSRQELLKMKNQLSQASQELEAAKRELMELKTSIRKKWKDVEEKFPRLKNWAASRLEFISKPLLEPMSIMN